MTTTQIQLLHSEIQHKSIKVQNKYITAAQQKAKWLRECGMERHPDVKLGEYPVYEVPEHKASYTNDKGYMIIYPELVNYIKQKYSLQHRNISKFIGDIPMKNLEDIIKFKKLYPNAGKPEELTILAPEEMFEVANTQNDPIVLCEWSSPVYYKCWNTGKMVAKSHIWNKSYLVVTKWGLEANDTLLTNYINN